MQEFQAAGICADCTVTIVAGPDEYLFGEEKAMLEVIEGKPPLPRLFPPYEHGLFATGTAGGLGGAAGAGPATAGSNPTLVNNVETLSNVPHILAHGADWFRSMGTAESPGTVVATVVGDVVAPDVGEVELGTPLRAVIDAVGSGVAAGRTVKAVFSGVANPVVTADLDVPVSYEGFEAHRQRDGRRRVHRATTTPRAWSTPPTACRASSRSSRAGSARRARSARARSPRTSSGSRPAPARTTTSRPSRGWLDRVTDGNRCYLAVEEQVVVEQHPARLPRRVRRAHRRSAAARGPRQLPIPKLLDLADGVATYDERSGEAARLDLRVAVGRAVVHSWLARLFPTSSAPLRSASTQSTSRSSSSFQLPSVGTSQVYDSDESNGLVPTNGSNISRHLTSAKSFSWSTPGKTSLSVYSGLA